MRHREVKIFDRMSMKGTQDLKVVKDIHAKALLNAYYSVFPFIKKVAREKERLYLGPYSYTNQGKKIKDTTKLFENVFNGRGKKKRYKYP